MTTTLAFAAGLLLALAVVAWVFGRTSLRGQRVADFAGKGPLFDPRRHLSGPILCEGVVYGPTGQVASRFVADMRGEWRGNTGTLSEEFRYDSGRTQSRRWTLSIGNDGIIRAEAADVVGTGRGVQEGPAVRLDYRIRLPAEAGGHVLDVTDWMYLMDNGTIMNRSQFRKFGFKVAELVATMRPAAA
jgi:hypothetical protein